MPRRTLASALILAAFVAQAGFLAPAAAVAQPVLDADALSASFRLRHGPHWEIRLDGQSGRPRRLAGGSLPVLSGAELSREDAGALAALRCQELLEQEASTLGLDGVQLTAAELPVVTTGGGQLHVVHFNVTHFGVPVLGARATLAVSHGNLIYGHFVGTTPVVASPKPLVGLEQALAAALDAAGMERSDLAVPPAPERWFLPEANGHRLIWQVTLIAADGPLRQRARIDARDGSLISLTDETVAMCDPVPPGGTERRVLGGVRPDRADDPERQELLPFTLVDTVAAGVDGFFSPPGAPYTGMLDGPVMRIECVGCSAPPQPAAPGGADGDVDFGTGGMNEVGNGTSTPADRTTYFHAEGALRQASRWLGVPWFSSTLPLRTNIPSACNAYWDGSSLNFFRSSMRCGNTGEIRDVIAHEWGHGLDDNDGLPTPGLSVDGATGEAVADIVALLRSRDSCIGESFFNNPGDWPSNTCSGVRDLDEKAAGHEHGTLDTTNALTTCPGSAFYRGPLGREGHCEGEIFGQVAWHFVQSLISGTAYGDGTPLPGGALPEEEAWQLLERLFYTSRPMMASYAPMSLQGIGTSAYDAFLVADDTGDGIANGTPHASAIHEAFAHHGVTELPMSPADTADCGPPSDPIVTLTAPTDPSTGLPTVRADWTDVGATAYHVLRADDPDDGYLPIGTYGAGAGFHVDRGVLPGRAYRYRVVAEGAAGCLSAGASPVLGSAGPLLRVSALVLDDTIGGNGDGVLEEGESADVFIELTNDGSGPATNLSVTLASTDPALAMVNAGPVAYGLVGAGATVPGPMAFRVRADPGVPRYVFLIASGEADEGCLRSQWLLELAVPDLVKAGQAIDDTLGGDGDLNWEPGEDIDLTIDLRNEGLLPARVVDATLSFRVPVPGVLLLQDTSTYPDVLPGATESNDMAYQLRADPTLGPRTPVPLQLEVRLAGMPHRTFDVDLTVGGFPAGTLEWSALGATTSPTPVVVQLTDDDGDGVITRCDTPDVVVGHWVDDVLRAFSGSDGSMLWESPVAPCIRFNAFGAFTAGDIDNDDENEIVFGDLDEFVCALRSDGSFFWKTAQAARCGGSGCVPQIWDLDGDGNVEVVAGHTMLRGVDGSVLWERAEPLTSRTLVADLDLDGSLEVIAGRKTWHADGTEYPGVFENLSFSGSVANFDNDDYPEIVSFGAGGTRGELRVFEHDGTLKFSRTDLTAGGRTGPPCVGDFDRDGFAEIGVPQETYFLAIDHDGMDMWTMPIDDSSGASGCSVFDFDRDGPPEIVYRDQAELMVFDGLTGEVLWRTQATSGTGYEYPQVVDLDGDGLAEVLVTGGVAGGTGALHAFGNPAWPSGRGVWNQEDYTVTNVEEDGSIPARPFPRWLTGNDFRGQASVCPCFGPEIDFTFRVDCDRTVCFTATSTGGRSPYDFVWDFGDGSPPGTGPTPCHTYAAPGDYPVRLTVEDTNTCQLDTGQIVNLRNELMVSVAAVVECAGTPSCLTETITGGLPPYDIEWDFGDGSPRDSSSAPCHLFPPGSFDATIYVRDALGCLAEASVPIVIDDPASLPEVSPPGSLTPLTVVRSSATDLELTFEDLGREVNVYQGDVRRLAIAGYTHEATTACRVAGGTATLTMPLAMDAYYLVNASRCVVPFSEGPYGVDSMGDSRPSASALGRPGCP